jgi:hypothetical protein
LFSRATLAPSASARTEARSHRGYLHIFREQSAVPLDLIRCFPFNGLRRPPRVTLLLPGRVRLQPPHCNSSRITRDLPAHRCPARRAAAPPLPAAEPVFARPCRVTPALAYACSRHLGLLLPQSSYSRVRQPRLQRPPRALRSTPAHATGFRCVTARMFAPPARRRSHSLLHCQPCRSRVRVHFLRDMRLHSPARTHSLPCTSTPPAVVHAVATSPAPAHASSAPEPRTNAGLPPSCARSRSPSSNRGRRVPAPRPLRSARCAPARARSRPAARAASHPSPHRAAAAASRDTRTRASTLLEPGSRTASAPTARAPAAACRCWPSRSLPGPSCSVALAPGPRGRSPARAPPSLGPRSPCAWGPPEPPGLSVW